MTKFEGCYLTNEGIAMVYDRGLGNLTFTKAVTGSGIYASKDEVPDLIELKEQKQEFSLDSFTREEDYTIGIKFKVKNNGLQEGYPLSEIGIYAKGDDNVEKLYCVAFATPGNTEDVPADDGGVQYITSVSIETVVSTDANVSIIFSDESEYTQKYVEEIVGEINVATEGTVAEQLKAIKETIEAPMETVTEFEPAANRENIKSGEKLGTVLGKVARFLSDLGEAAFRSVANNLTTTEEGSLLDARQGAVLQKEIDQVNSDLGNCINYIGDNKDILPTTTKTYTATQNGILNVTMTCKDIYSYTDTGRLAITLNNGFKEIRLGGANTYAMTANMPMKKGQTATIECNGTVSSVEFFHL